MDIQFTYAMAEEVREKNRFTNIFPGNVRFMTSAIGMRDNDVELLFWKGKLLTTTVYEPCYTGVFYYN